MFKHGATRTHWGDVVDATIRELSTSALPISPSASTSDHITFNEGRPVHTVWKIVDATSSIKDISKTNLPPSPGTKPLPKVVKPAALPTNQIPTQGRQTNLLPPPGTKPPPNVVKKTCCLLQEPNPCPRTQLLTSLTELFLQAQRHAHLLFYPVSSYFLPLTSCILLRTLFSLSLSPYVVLLT